LALIYENHFAQKFCLDIWLLFGSLEIFFVLHILLGQEVRVACPPCPWDYKMGRGQPHSCAMR